jgi:hypothetical protein
MSDLREAERDTLIRQKGFRTYGNSES